MAKLKKVEGATETCPSCKDTMYCRSKTSQDGTVTLQWQTEDGRSHYLAPKEIAGKTVFECRQSASKVNDAVQTIKEQKIQLKDIDLPMEVLDKSLHVSKSACQFLKAIEYTVYEQLGQDANPAHVGMYVHIIADKLLGIPGLDKLLESVGGKDE